MRCSCDESSGVDATRRRPGWVLTLVGLGLDDDFAAALVAVPKVMVVVAPTEPGIGSSTRPLTPPLADSWRLRYRGLERSIPPGVPIHALVVHRHGSPSALSMSCW